MDLSVDVQVEDVNARAAFGRSAAGILEDHEVTITVAGLVEGVTARIPAPTPAPGLTYTGDCKDGCVVTQDQPSAVIGVVNDATEEQRVTFGASPVGGRETNAQDNQTTWVFRPRDVTPPPQPATVDFGIQAPMTATAESPGASGKHTSRIDVTVTGVSGSGHVATLTATTSTGTVTTPCGNPCTVTTDGVYTFVVQFGRTLTETTTFSIAPPPGVQDRNSWNDRRFTVITGTLKGRNDNNGDGSGGGSGGGRLLETVVGTVGGLLRRG